MHKTFISYHHKNEQEQKDYIIEQFGADNFIDKSVGDGDIDPDLSDETIMNTIRTDYLQTSTVTLVLVGWETASRPFINSEMQSSLRDTQNNKHNGLLAVVKDDLYDYIYTNGVCSCGCNTRSKTSWFNTCIPDLVKKNNVYEGTACHFKDSDVYCSIIKYTTFISDPEKYINEAHDKRDNKAINIKKLLDPSTPRIGKR